MEVNVEMDGWIHEQNTNPSIKSTIKKKEFTIEERNKPSSSSISSQTDYLFFFWKHKGTIT